MREPGTSHPLRFGGRSSISIPAGATATSDPIGAALPPLSDLAITLYLPDATLPTTSHPQAATGYRSGAVATSLGSLDARAPVGLQRRPKTGVVGALAGVH